MSANRPRFSLLQFHRFLKLAGQECLIHDTTLEQWREAVNEFKPVLKMHESQDLRCVEINLLSRRYIKTLVGKHTSITPWRILILQRLMAAAVGEFIAFTINPEQYRQNRNLLKFELHAVIAAA